MPSDSAGPRPSDGGSSDDADDPAHSQDSDPDEDGSVAASLDIPDDPHAELMSAVAGPRTPEEETAYELRLRISQFQWTIDALRELVDVLLPQAAELDNPKLEPVAKEAVSRLTKAKRKELSETLSRAFGDPRQDDGEPLGVSILRIFGEDYRGFRDFATGFAASMMSPRRVHLVGASLLTTAVGAFEVLIAGVVGTHFRLFPQALDEEHKEFSLEDLRGFESIRDAEAEAVDRRVTSTMRDGFEAWKKWLTSRLQCDFAALCVDEAQLTEIFQRRHIIVHNAGRVSKHYLNAVALDDPPALGRALVIDATYLSDALDALNVAGLAIGLVSTAKWLPDRRDRAGEDGSDQVYALLREQRWRAVARLAEIVKPLVKQQSTKQSLMVNAWIARKRLGETEAVAAEVKKWDTSALDTTYGVAQLTLLGLTDPAFELLSQLVAANKINAKHLNEWPLFDDLREDERFQKVIDAASERRTQETGSDAGQEKSAPDE